MESDAAAHIFYNFLIRSNSIYIRNDNFYRTTSRQYMHG